MSVVRIVSSTVGQSSPASIGIGKPYRWRGIPGWEPGNDRYDGEADPHPANVARRAGRAARLDEYSRRRLAGETPEQAQAGMRIAPGTRRDYERVFLAGHPEMRPS